MAYKIKEVYAKIALAVEDKIYEAGMTASFTQDETPEQVQHQLFLRNMNSLTELLNTINPPEKEKKDEKKS